jgi:hypothetical protein
MTMPARQPGSFGRRPPKRAPAIQFANIRRFGAPAVPPSAVDYLSPLGGGWLMCGNGPDDSVFPGFPGCGDCVAAEWANNRRVITTALSNTPEYPAWPDILAAYQTQNPSFDPSGDPSTTGPGSPADGGMDIQTWLEFLVAHPGFGDGGQLVGFASVDFTNPEEVQAAIAAGGVLIIGINVQEDQQTQFSDDEPWDWVASDPVEGGHCLAPGTRVLTDDLRWVPIEDVLPGEGLVGFEEDRAAGAKTRRFRRSVVESSSIISLPCYELEFENGTVVTASEDHLWLVDPGRGPKRWLRTDQMRVRGPGGSYGTKAQIIAPVYEEDTGRDAGYLAAAFDGEGWIDNSQSKREARPGVPVRVTNKLGFAQNDGVMWRKVTQALKARGFNYRSWDKPGEYQRDGDTCLHLTVGGREQVLRFLGSIRPHRLLSKFNPDHLGALESKPCALVRKTFIGEHPVVAVATSTRTFIAEGFASHNCTAVGGYGAAPAGSDPAMAGDEKFITWGQETSFTDNFWANGVEELWFAVWAE